MGLFLVKGALKHWSLWRSLKVSMSVRSSTMMGEGEIAVPTPGFVSVNTERRDAALLHPHQKFGTFIQLVALLDVSCIIDATHNADTLSTHRHDISPFHTFGRPSFIRPRSQISSLHRCLAPLSRFMPGQRAGHDTLAALSEAASFQGKRGHPDPKVCSAG